MSVGKEELFEIQNLINSQVTISNGSNTKGIFDTIQSRERIQKLISNLKSFAEHETFNIPCNDFTIRCFTCSVLLGLERNGEYLVTISWIPKNKKSEAYFTIEAK